jgi:hypothetical protein
LVEPVVAHAIGASMFAGAAATLLDSWRTLMLLWVTEELVSAKPRSTKPIVFAVDWTFARTPGLPGAVSPESATALLEVEEHVGVPRYPHAVSSVPDGRSERARIAGAGNRDVLFDFGSGWGQTMIVALTEYDLRMAVGIEIDPERCEEASRRLDEWAILRPELSLRFRIVEGDYYDVAQAQIPEAPIEEATIVYYGHGNLISVIADLEEIGWKDVTANDKRRLVYKFPYVFPEIMPDVVDFPYFVSKYPFTTTASESDWLSKVTGMTKSSLHPGAPDSVEMWMQLKHDLRLTQKVQLFAEYMRRLESIL